MPQKFFSVARKSYNVIRWGQFRYLQYRCFSYSRKRQGHAAFGFARVRPLVAVGLVFASCQAVNAEKTNDLSETARDTTAPDERKPQADDTDIKALIVRAIHANKDGRFDEADKICHQALELIHNYQSDGLWPPIKILKATIYVYDLMANICLNNGKFDMAETLFKECMKGLLQTGAKSDDNAIVEISLKLALIYALQNKVEDAEIGYNFCIDSQSKKLENLDAIPEEERANSRALLGMCLHSYGKFLLELKRYKEAEDRLEESLALARTAIGEKSDQVAVLYCDLSNALAQQGKYAQALELIQQAIEATTVSESPDMVAFLCNQGPLEAQLSGIKLGRTSCAKAMRMAKTLQNPSLVDLAKACYKRVDDIKKEKMKS